MKIVKNTRKIKILKIINVIISLGILAIIAKDWTDSIPENKEETIKITLSLYGLTPLFLNYINSKIRGLYHKGDIIENIYKESNDQDKEKLYNYALKIYEKETH